ncbi:hypothetical protein CU098_001619, partial [Rhizopus stolonifer]
WDKGDNTGPIVLRTTAKNSVFGHFRIIGAPNGHIAVTTSKDVVFENIYLRSRSQNKNFARNTDAWGVAWSKNIVFRNSEVIVGDDCTAINGGVTNITISNIKCVEGHGFSMTGSLDLSRPEYFKSVYFYNNECHRCQNGIRIKTTAGATGTIDDIQYKNMLLVSVENPVQVTTHYFCQQDGTCGNDKSLSITNVLIENVYGGHANANDLVSFDINKMNPNWLKRTKLSEFGIQTKITLTFGIVNHKFLEIFRIYQLKKWDSPYWKKTYNTVLEFAV